MYSDQPTMPSSVVTLRNELTRQPTSQCKSSILTIFIDGSSRRAAAIRIVDVRGLITDFAAVTSAGTGAVAARCPMEQDPHQSLEEAIGRFDAELRRLSDLGIDLSRPGRELLASLRARRDEMRRQHAELEGVRREADRALLPRLLDLYRRGAAADREFVRDLLRR